MSHSCESFLICQDRVRRRLPSRRVALGGGNKRKKKKRKFDVLSRERDRKK